MLDLVRTFKVGKLKIKIFSTRNDIGEASGQSVAEKMREILKAKKELSIVFASAPSQNEFLKKLSQSPGIDWNRVTAFHLDEYIGLSREAPQSFGYFLHIKLFGKVHPGNVYYINGGAGDLEAECHRYAELLKKHPLDIACIGIGENGHIAFNDPPFANFEDPELVKVVDLDPISREQQIRDGCFKSLQEVPQKAITLTIPAILSASFIYCMVPGPTKAEAVKRMLEEPISTNCPASILRQHENALLFLDRDSAKKLNSL